MVLGVIGVREQPACPPLRLALRKLDQLNEGNMVVVLMSDTDR